MTADPTGEARHEDEEARYRAVAALDLGDPGARAQLLERLGDESWRVRAAVVERLAAAADPGPWLPALVGALVSGRGIGARDAASEALVRLGAVAVLPLLERVADPDPGLRQAVVFTLGQLGDLRAAGPISERLGDPDPNVRSAAAEALARLGGPEALAALRALVADPDPALRLAAVEGLAAMRAWPEGLAVDALLADPALRRPAYRLLGACDDPEVVAPIAAGLAERSRTVREAALAAVGQQRARRGPEALAPLAAAARARLGEAPAASVDACVAALGSEEPYVAMGALAVLGWVGSARHARAALRLADDERHRALVEEALLGLPRDAALRVALADTIPELGPAARLTALAVLARLGSPAALESLVRDASDPEAYVQAEAVAALGRISDARVVPPLAGLLGDEQPAVAGVAAGALVELGRSGGPAAAAALTALRSRAGSSPSAALYRALGALGGPGDVEFLRAGLAAGAPGRRAAAAGALAALAARDPAALPLALEAAPALADALGDAAWPVRVAAARALSALARAATLGGRPAPRGAAPALAAALADGEAAVRGAAAEALGACGGPEHEATLAALAEDPAGEGPVVVAALRGLVALGAATAARVSRAAVHPDPEVAKEAVAAAAVLPGAEAEAIVVAAAGSPHWDVRRAAAAALLARGDPNLANLAVRLAAAEPDPLVARAFAEAAAALRDGAK